MAERLRPDLASFCAGGNDIIRIACDTDDPARHIDAALARIPATGAHVLVFTGFDLGRMHPLIRRLRGRIACYNGRRGRASNAAAARSSTRGA